MRIHSSILLCLVLFILTLVGCWDASNQDPLATPVMPANESSTLPEWLRVRPDGWGEASWKEFQGSLIELRKPILRSDDYTAQELQAVTAEVEHWPGDYEDKILEEWLEKWKAQLDSYERTGGCGCCNEVYTVTGPEAAIQEFPIQRGRRQYYPRYLDEKPKNNSAPHVRGDAGHLDSGQSTDANP